MGNVSAEEAYKTRDKQTDTKTKGIKQGLNGQPVTGTNRNILTCDEMGARGNRKRTGGGGGGGRASGPS
jgi:hypothetical protein